jgi:proline iminopeptidase
MDLLTTIHSEGAELAARSRNGTQPPVLMVPGGPGVPDYLGPVATMLLPRTTWRFDPRGTGASRCLDGRFGVDAWLDDLSALQQASGASRVDLFAHSFGAVAAQLYAMEHPERVNRLFLANPAVGVGWDFVRMVLRVQQHTQRAAGLRYPRMLAWGYLSTIPGPTGRRAFERFTRHIWRNWGLTPEDDWLEGVSRRAAVGASVSMLVGRPLDANVPTTIVYGERDIYGDLGNLVARRYPDATLHVLPGCGHLPWIDDREAFAEVLREQLG